MNRLAMVRGDTKDLTVTLTAADGTALDLDDLSDIVFSAKWRYDDTTDTGTTISKTLGDGITISDPATAGICVIRIDPADTSDFEHGHRLVWDIEVVADYDNAVRTVARGYLWVYQDVTS